MYYACLSVRPFAINVKTTQPIGPKFCVGPQMSPGLRFKGAENYKNLCPKVLEYC